MFACVVPRSHWSVHLSTHRRSVDDGSLISRSHIGNNLLCYCSKTKQVHLKLFSSFLNRNIFYRAIETVTSVVPKHIDFSFFLNNGVHHILNIGFIGNVHLNRMSAHCFKILHLFNASSNSIDDMTLLNKGNSRFLTHSRTSTCNKNNFLFHFLNY